VQNTITNPLPDGGGKTSIENFSTQSNTCANAPRSFMNEASCKMSTDPNACGYVVISGYQEPQLTLNNTMLVALHQMTGRYVYLVDSLRIDSAYATVYNPCTKDMRSRWMKVTVSGSCETITWDATTHATIVLLLNSTDGAPLIDIVGPSTGCTVNPSYYGARIKSNAGNCYENIHHDRYSVYDMTYWALPDTHPGT